MANVGLCRAVRDEQLALDDADGLALPKEQEHLFFSRRQLVFTCDGRYARCEFVLLFGGRLLSRFRCGVCLRFGHNRNGAPIARKLLFRHENHRSGNDGNDRKRARNNLDVRRNNAD